MRTSALVVLLALSATAAAGELTLEITGITDGVDPIPQFQATLDLATGAGQGPLSKVVVGIIEGPDPIPQLTDVLATIVDDPEPLGLQDVVDEPDPFGLHAVAPHFSVIDLPDPVSSIVDDPDPLGVTVVTAGPPAPGATLVVIAITDGVDPVPQFGGASDPVASVVLVPLGPAPK